MPINVVELTNFGVKIVFATVMVYLALLIFIKVKRAKGSGFDLSAFIGVGFFLLFSGITQVIFGYYDYFTIELGIPFISLYKAANIMGIIGIIGVTFFSEKMLRKTKYGFTVFAIGGVIYATFFVFSSGDIRLLNFIIVPICMVIVAINFIYYLVARSTKEIRRKMVLVVITFVMYAFFYILHGDVGLTLLPFPKEVTNIIGLVSLTFISIFFAMILFSFETFTEFGWKAKMRELFIISPNGVALFHYSFVENTHTHNSDLVSAGLTGVQAILAEMVQSKQQLKTVDHQDVKVLFEYGTYSTLALVASENLNIYRSKLTLLSTQFERLFQDVLSHLTGDIEVFLPAKQLIDDIFG